jgi:hypothetical protein
VTSSTQVVVCPPGGIAGFYLGTVRDDLLESVSSSLILLTVKDSYTDVPKFNGLELKF